MINTYDNNTIEKQLKIISEKIGSLTFIELLELQLGDDYRKYFDYDMNKRIDFYNETFQPNTCILGPDLLDMFGTNHNFAGLIEPAIINIPDTKKVKNALATGCFLC